MSPFYLSPYVTTNLAAQRWLLWCDGVTSFLFVLFYAVIGAVAAAAVVICHRQMTTRVVVSSCHQKGEWAKKKRPLTFLSHQNRVLVICPRQQMSVLFHFSFSLPSQFLVLLLHPRAQALHHVPKGKKCDSFTVQLDLSLYSTTKGKCGREARKSKAKEVSSLFWRSEARVVYICCTSAVYIRFIAHPLKRKAYQLQYSTVTELLGIYRIDRVDFACFGGFGKKNANARKRSKKIWALFAPSSGKTICLHQRRM
jgi:hypothetical protein